MDRSSQSIKIGRRQLPAPVTIDSSPLQSRQTIIVFLYLIFHQPPTADPWPPAADSWPPAADPWPPAADPWPPTATTLLCLSSAWQNLTNKTHEGIRQLITAIPTLNLAPKLLDGGGNRRVERYGWTGAGAVLGERGLASRQCLSGSRHNVDWRI